VFREVFISVGVRKTSPAWVGVASGQRLKKPRAGARGRGCPGQQPTPIRFLSAQPLLCSRTSPRRVRLFSLETQSRDIRTASGRVRDVLLYALLHAVCCASWTFYYVVVVSLLPWRLRDVLLHLCRAAALDRA
jgi:hypothetical protein